MLRYWFHGAMAFASVSLLFWGAPSAHAQAPRPIMLQNSAGFIPLNRSMTVMVRQPLLIADDESIEECGDSDGDGNCDSEAETQSES